MAVKPPFSNFSSDQARVLVFAHNNFSCGTNNLIIPTWLPLAAAYPAKTAVNPLFKLTLALIMLEFWFLDTITSLVQIILEVLLDCHWWYIPQNGSKTVVFLTFALKMQKFFFRASYVMQIIFEILLICMSNISRQNGRLTAIFLNLVLIMLEFWFLKTKPLKLNKFVDGGFTAFFSRINCQWVI